MPVTLSIKNAPDDVVARLRERAARNHRSLQGELLTIIEEAAKPRQPAGSFLSTAQLLEEIRQLRITVPADSGALLRADRDRDEGR